jgi:branched-chain amino acid transport system substrate-binding protein
MPAIGILLPGSTLYPSIGIDFSQGVRAYFKCHGMHDLALHNFPIGYGLNENDIYKQAEKFLLTDDVDVVIAYADDHMAKKLSPLFAAAGKLLVITNAGANYPGSSTSFSNTLFHSLNDSLYSFITGQLCSRLPEHKKAIMATSYYDGGYQHCHAMINAYEMAGGELCFNFINQFNKEAFNIGSLAAFIQSNPAINTLLCLYSGDMARCFYEQIAPLQLQYNLQLFGSPMLFDSTPGDFDEANPFVKHIRGYIGWTPTLPNVQNQDFIAFFKKAFNREANLFSLQGWETALLVNNYLQQRAAGASIIEAVAQLQQQPLQSPRGNLQLNGHYAVTGPAYLVSATGAMNIKVEETVENTGPAWKEMMAQVPDSAFSTWHNTYLCI